VFRDLFSAYTLEVARGIVDAAAELDVDVVTGTTSRGSISQWLEECAALEEAGIAYDPAIVRSTDFDFEEAPAATLEVLRSDAPPTAVFAASDAQALGVLEDARQRGLSVPRDLAVMSFDDTLVAAMACPPLSAVRQPFDELGHEATRVLMQLAEGRPPASTRIELATELVLRSSTSPRPRVATE
jgi:LacI family transcriptional regulator/LacI family xylobiose transport system transcriptional regulator